MMVSQETESQPSPAALPQKGPSSAAPVASVVVCVYNRPHQIKECIHSLLNQSYRPLEIIIVDDGSTDQTPQVLTTMQKENKTDILIRVVSHGHNLGLCHSRNTGLAIATGGIILFMDSDCTAHPHWVAHMVRALSDSEYVGASGTVIDDAPRNCAEWAAAGTTRISNGKLQGRKLVGCNMAFRIESIREHLFDPAIRCYADEDDLALRMTKAGCRFAFVPDAIVYHHHRYTLRSYLRQAWLQGQGSAYFWWKHRRYIGRDLVFLFLAFITLPLALLGSPWWIVPLGFFSLHVLAHAFNEKVFKGKSWPVTFWVLPLVLLHSAVKLASVISFYLRLPWKKSIDPEKPSQLTQKGINSERERVCALSLKR